MSYNYLDLVNEVNRRLNEVELTTSAFTNAGGFYGQVKDSINSSLRDIYHVSYEWPFNHVLAEETLSVGVTRYAFPTDANTIDFDTFRIKGDTTLGNNTKKLAVASYEDYLSNAVDQEYTTDTTQQAVPLRVFHCPSLEFGVTPAPDKAYTLFYEYYRIPVDLNSYSDVPSVPERFRHVIIDGAMFYAYMFRGNEQSATIAKNKFEEGVKRMRTMLINRYSYMRSGTITPSKATAFGDRVK